MDNQPIVTTQVQQDPLFSLEEFAVTKTNSIEELKKQLKEAKTMLDDTLKANSVYVTKDNAVKEATKERTVVKKQIMSDPGVQNLVQRIKGIAQEIKEKTAEVSDYALEYQRLSGATEIQKNGVTYDIVKVAKLVKRVQ